MNSRGRGRKRKKPNNFGNTKRNSEPVSPEVKEYLDAVKYVYNKINKNSDLLWSHDGDLVKPKRRSTKRRSKDIESDTNKRKRDQADDVNSSEEEEPNWQKNSNAQIGYGEITKGAMQKFLTILQNIDKYFKSDHEPYLVGSKEEYCLTKDSTFIDIGSGFGKPVFHAALQVGCYSKGVEIVPARVSFCIDFIYEYEEDHKDKITAELKRLQKEGVEDLSSLMTPTKSPSKRSGFKKICNPLASDYTDLNFVEGNKGDEEKKGNFCSFQTFYLNLSSISYKFIYRVRRRK